MKKSITRFIAGLIALLSYFPASAQAQYIDYEEWQKMPRVFPQVLMFTADWCGPSESMSRTINQLAQEYAGRVQFFFVDYDENAEWASSWRCAVLPTTYFIYESDIANNDYSWRGEKSSVPISHLRDVINWTLSNWKLTNLPAPVSSKDSNEETDIINIMSAALGGDVDTMADLGNWLPPIEAVMWNYLAMQNGHPDATYRYGSYFLSYNPAKAKKLIEEAAEKGSLLACEFLVEAYRYGYHGFPKDEKKAWYFRRLQYN